MKSEEELLKIIHANEYILDSKARFIFLDKENDELLVELTVMIASPKVGEEGEILEPNYHQIRHAVRLKLKFSDLFMLPSGNEPPQRDINYAPKFEFLEEKLTQHCAYATGKHDQECDIVAGLSADLKDAREEVFDLYHQACLVHPNSSEDPIREFQYDNQCMSTYESIEEKLIEWGLLKPEQCLRRINKEKT